VTPTSSLTWVKSSRCDSNHCVEAAITSDGAVAVRNSQAPDGPVVLFSMDEWKAFVGGVENGEFTF
jgi:uncharacterized protein DUF397